MFVIVEVATIIFAAVATSLALAHALELPGKLRLGREQYLAVQPIYYPGFTLAGASEPLTIVMIMIVVLSSLPGTPPFWLALAALVVFLAMHAVYWLVTHPVNSFWLADTRLDAAASGFFAVARRGGAGADWKSLRDRWEYSHVVRAALGLTGLALVAAAAAV